VFPFFWEFVAESGERRRLPIQAKKECEIAGQVNILMTPTNSEAGSGSPTFVVFRGKL